MWKQQSLKILLKSSTDTTAPSPSSTDSDSDVDESGTPLESGDDLESTLSDGVPICLTTFFNLVPPLYKEENP